jgi:hypothetical protein
MAWRGGRVEETVKHADNQHERITEHRGGNRRIVLLKKN